MPTIEIAKRLNSTANTVNNRIKKLIKLGVIQGFRIGIDFPKLGYNFYKADIELKEPNEYSKILKYIELNPNLYQLIKSIGYVDLELVFILTNVNQLHQIMDDLSIKFPNTIKKFTYFTATETYKWDHMIRD